MIALHSELHCTWSPLKASLMGKNLFLLLSVWLCSIWILCSGASLFTP